MKQYQSAHIPAFKLMIMIVFVFSCIMLNAQDKKATGSANQTKIVLDVKQLASDLDAKRLDDMLKSYPGKILNYSIDKANRQVTVFISQDLQIVDLLEVFSMTGYNAGYENTNGEYVKLDASGRQLTVQPYLKK